MRFDRTTNKTLVKIRDAIINQINTKNISSTGEAINSLEIQENKLLGNDYIFFLDKGRAPGRFPPVENIRDWVRAKIKPAENTVNQFAFLVGRKISREGTEIYKNPSKGIGLDNIINEAIEQMLKDIPGEASIEAKKFLKI